MTNPYLVSNIGRKRVLAGSIADSCPSMAALLRQHGFTSEQLCFSSSLLNSLILHVAAFIFSSTRCSLHNDDPHRRLWHFLSLHAVPNATLSQQALQITITRSVQLLEILEHIQIAGNINILKGAGWHLSVPSSPVRPVPNTFLVSAPQTPSCYKLLSFPDEIWKVMN